MLVELPPSELGHFELGEKTGPKLARFFYRFERAVVEAAGKDDEVRPPQLPDGLLLPSGRLAP